MKKILIIDDDIYKIENIKNLLYKIDDSYDVKIKKALNPGLKRLLEDQFDLILLDMSMPVFDLSETKNFDHFGGVTFLKEMKRKRILTPTIIVTQYEIFGEGSTRKTSSSIDLDCKEQFPNYKGLILYSSTDNSWKESMVKSIGEVFND